MLTLDIETSMALKREIQDGQGCPCRRPPNAKSPRRIMVMFHTKNDDVQEGSPRRLRWENLEESGGRLRLNKIIKLPDPDFGPLIANRYGK